METYFKTKVDQLVKRDLVKIQDQVSRKLQAELLFYKIFCPNFECCGILSLNTKIGALFACMLHLVTDCQEVLCTQSVTEISIPSFIDEVFKFTYLIAETTQVNVNAQNQDFLVQKEKSTENNCVYMYRIDIYFDLLRLFILPRYMKNEKNSYFADF